MKASQRKAMHAKKQHYRGQVGVDQGDGKLPPNVNVSIKRLDKTEQTAKMISHQFGNADVKHNGKSYTITFSESSYNKLDPRKLDKFEENYPNVKMDINSKNHTITVSGLGQ